MEDAGGEGSDGFADSSPGDSCWLGEVGEVWEVAELVGSWSKKVATELDAPLGSLSPSLISWSQGPVPFCFIPSP